MDERGMENEHLEQRNSSNTEYLPTKCRVTKPPPPKPATNPLQFIKVAPPPLFQKAKEQISKVEKIKKERKEVQDEAEDWQANLDNWKSSRRKLQEHIIERVVEVKKFEQEDVGKIRRKSKTFNEILEERGKSKYTIPIYIDESNDWSDYGISDSKGDKSEKSKSSKHDEMEAAEQCSDANSSSEIHDMSTCEAQFNSKLHKMDVRYNNNDYNAFTTQHKETKASQNSSKNGQYTYEGAIEGYRSRIKTKIDDTLFINNSDSSKSTTVITEIVPKGEIGKRKGMFDKQSTDVNSVPNSAARVLQDFENSVSIKQRLKSLEKCTDQTVKYVDNVNFTPKVKQISQLFDKSDTPCVDNVKNHYNKEITLNNNYPQRREKLNINIVPWEERETACENTDIFMYMDKNDLKDIGSQSDDKSSDTFYSALEDSNYPPSIASTDYMALSSDREDSGIHTADVSCSVSQADDTAEDQESNANSHDDFHSRPKYYKCSEDINLLGNRILKLSRENVSSLNLESDDEHTVHCNFGPDTSYEKDIIAITAMFVENLKQDSSEDVGQTLTINELEINLNSTESISDDSAAVLFSPVIMEEIPKEADISSPFVPSNEAPIDSHLVKMSTPFSTNFTHQEFIFDADFPLLPTKMIEPPKVKPPPPPVLEEDKSVEPGFKRVNSTGRIKKEITMKRSNFLGLIDKDYEDAEFPEGNSNVVPDNEKFSVEETLSKEFYENKIDARCSEEIENKELEVDPVCCSSSCDGDAKVETQIDKENETPCQEDEIIKREREIIEMVEKSEKFRDLDITPEVSVPKPAVRLSHSSPPKRAIDKPADASYYDKQPDYLDDQDSEVLKVEQELQQLEQEELKRKRDSLLFRQARSRMLAKTKRYSLENIFDCPSTVIEYRKSMPELQYLKVEKEQQAKAPELFRSIHEIDLKYRKSVPNIPEYLYPGYNSSSRNDIQTVEKYERRSFQHDIHRSAFEAPMRKPMLPFEPLGSAKQQPNSKFILPREPLVHNKPLNFVTVSGETSPLVKPRNRNALNASWLKARPNVETKSYDQHWLYQEAELRRLQDQKNYQGWQQGKHSSEQPVPNFIQRVPIPQSVNSGRSSVKKLSSIDNHVPQQYMEHQPLSPQLPDSQPQSVAVEEGQNRILSVSGKKKCSFCGNELGRGAAMIIETLCLFYHMECFKCCVCHVQLGNGLNGTDVRVRNQKLHCHNCYSSDDGVKFSCV